MPPETAPRKRSTARRALLLAGLLSVLLLAVYSGLKSPFVDAYLARRVPAWAEAHGVQVEFASLDFDPWGPALRATELRVAASDREWEGSARWVRIRLLALKSLAGVPHLEIELDAPRFEGEIREEVGAETRPAFPRFVCETLRVSEGALDVRLPGHDLRLELPLIDISWFENRGAGLLAGGRVAWKGGEEAVNKVAFAGRRRFAGTRVDRVVVDSQRLDVEVSGRIGAWGDLNLGLDARAEVSRLPPKWVEALGLAGFRPIETDVTVSARIGGSLEQPVVEGHLALASGRFGPLEIVALEGDFTAGSNGLEARGLVAQTTAGGVQGVEARLSWIDDRVDLDARGRALGYDLRRFMALFVDGPFPVGVTASGSFDVKGPLYPDLALTARVEADARDLDVTVGDELTTVFALPSARVTSECTVGRSDLKFAATRVETDSVSVTVASGGIEYTEGLWFDTDVVLRGLDLVRNYVPQGFDAAGRLRGRFGGPYTALSFHYDLDLQSVFALGHDWGRLRGQADYDLRDLTLRGAVLEGAAGRLAFDGRAGLVPGGTADLGVEGSELNLAVLAEILRDWIPTLPEDVSGRGRVSGRVTGPVFDPSFAGTVEGAQVSARGIRIDGVQAEGTGSLQNWSLRRATVHAYGARADVAGRGDWRQFSVSGELEGVDLFRLGAVWGDPIPLAGVFSGSVKVEGPYRSPSLVVRGPVRDAAAWGHALGRTDVYGRLQGPEVSAELSAFDDALLARGNLQLTRPNPFSVALEARELPWTILPSDAIPTDLRALNVSGRGRVEGTLADGLAGLRAEWAGDAGGVCWGELDLGTVRIGVDYQKGGASFSLAVWDGEVRAEGLISSEAGAPFAGSVQLEGLQLERLHGLLPPNLLGRVTARGKALLSLDEWAVTRGLGRLQALADVDLEGTVSGLTASGRGAAPEVRFRVSSPTGTPQFRVVSEGAEVNGFVDDPATLTWHASARLDGFTPNPFLPDDHPMEGVGGNWTGAADARGLGLEVREASTRGQVDGLAWGPLAPTVWTWSGGWDGSTAAFEAREPRGVTVIAQWDPGQKLSVSGELADVPVQGWVRGERFPADLKGTVRGRAALDIPAHGRPEGRAVLSRVVVDLPPVRLVNNGDLVFGYRDGAIRAEAVSLRGDSVDLSVSGGIRPGTDWEADLSGLVDLGLLARMVPEVKKAAGTARIELGVRGPWNAPRFAGPVEILAGAMVGIKGLDHPLEDLDASAYLEETSGITVEWVDAQFGPGRVHLEGSVGLEGFLPGKLRLYTELRNVAYEAPIDVSYTLDADLLVTGMALRPEIRGEVRLTELLYARRLNWKTMVFETLKRRPKEVKQKTEEGTVFVDVTARGSENLRVENNLGQFDLAFELRARGYLPNPALWGRADVLDGTAVLRAQEYEVLRSSVEFLGETQPIPRLDVHARTHVREHTVTVNIVGPLDDFVVSTTASPPLSQTDILALLTYGSTADEMEGGGGVTAVEAASFLTGSLQDELETGVGAILGVDEFHIDPAYSPTAQTTVPRVTVGKTVTKDLRARYSAAISGETEQDLEVQYTLDPHVSVLGTWSDKGSESKGSVGGEVRVRFTFR